MCSSTVAEMILIQMKYESLQLQFPEAKGLDHHKSDGSLCETRSLYDLNWTCKFPPCSVRFRYMHVSISGYFCLWADL